MKDWSEIRALHRRDGLSKREISRRLGIFWVTVDRAFVSDRPPMYSRPAVVKRLRYYAAPIRVAALG